MEIALREASERIQEQTRELTRTNADLTKASQAKSEFLAHISHELRTPLNTVLAFGRLLSEPTFGTLNVRQQRFADHIVTSGVHLLQLINDIIDISRVEAGRIDLALAPMNVRECLASCQSIVAGMAISKEIDLRIENPPAGTIIHADETRVKQVILNLLDNAIKFTPEGGKVYLSASVSEGELHISVKDTGIGIKSRYRQQIFDLFDQGAPEVSKQYGGSGLGLSLVKHLVTLHHGRVWLQSKVGKGSTFTVALPIVSNS